MQKQRSDLRRIAIIALSTAALMWGLLYAPTPYVLFEPGIATPVKPMVTIKEGDPLGKGEFLLTAVKMTEPNFWRTIQTVWNSNIELHLKKEVLGGYTKEQYAKKLSVVMHGSQNNAIEAAYRYAGLPYDNKLNHFLIHEVHSGESTSTSSFQAEDKWIGIHGEKQPDSLTDMLSSLKGYNKNKIVPFDIVRGGQKVQLDFPLTLFDAVTTSEQLLEVLGISSLSEQRSLDPASSGDRIDIKAGDIGGPSAGLVFALQAVDLLTDGDLSGGHRIAATGTITIDGEVGSIGGIKQKVVIASKEGAQMFLVPDGNFKDAEAKAKSLNASMKIVSVSTLLEAVEQINQFVNGNNK